jgi:hypothetical protein
MEHTKLQVNEMLFALIGSAELVAQWWKSPNWHFKLKTPEDIWESSPNEVFDYVYANCLHEGGS